MIRLSKVIEAIETLYPLSFAEEWDEPGLIVGDLNSQIQRIVCVSDPTISAVDRALSMGANLLVTHHPLFFKAVHGVSNETVRGEIVQRLISNNCALWVGHTNADVAWRGVAHAAAEYFGLHNLRPIVVSKQIDSAGRNIGLGRIGVLDVPISLRDFAQNVFNVLPHTKVGVQVAGNLDAKVSTVAVLPGSGESLLDEVRKEKVDVYVTSDLRHHPALDAIERAKYESKLRLSSGEDYIQHTYPMIINTSHSAIESLWLLMRLMILLTA